MMNKHQQNSIATMVPRGTPRALALRVIRERAERNAEEFALDLEKAHERAIEDVRDRVERRGGLGALRLG